ncbi:MAG: hypothetical protein ACI8UO_006273 [Verrucomicrobiales bacterium]|jgi:hypothetical protein
MRNFFIPILLSLSAFSLLAEDFVWVEGESAVSQSVQANSWYGSIKADELSGGGWISHWGDAVGTADYKMEVPSDGTYVLWVRANPVKSKMNIRFDEGTWYNVNFGRKQETINIASDDKPDLRFVGWVRVGVKKFSAGAHDVEVRFNSDNSNHGGLDCFCLTTDADWKPVRTLKPGDAAPSWDAPVVTADNLDKWLDFLRPTEEEVGWRKVRWHHSLSEAAAEARELQRPILLWAMNGHPCGET